MKQTLTVRLPSDVAAKADARAAELGLDRAGYFERLIEQDVRSAGPDRRKRAFASEDFIGSAPLGSGPYTNRRVRELVRSRTKT